MQHLHFRSLWVSDTHLGGRNLKSDQLYDFLASTESDYLYLVGDIFDLWKLRKNWCWPEINDRIVNLILKKACNGTKVYYLPGNHDDIVRKYAGTVFCGVVICEDVVHTALDGRKYLVMHGDKFDCVIQHSRWLADLGSILYDTLLVLNRWYNRYRSLRGRQYFSISAWLKHKSPSKRTSRPFSGSSTPAPRWWWETGRPERSWKNAIRTPISPATAPEANWRATSAAPMSWCSRALPTPSGW